MSETFNESTGNQERTFNENQQEVTEKTEVNPDEIKKFMEDFKTVQKRLDDSQDFISQLKDENRVYREQLEKLQSDFKQSTNLQDVLDELKGSTAQKQTTTAPSADEIASKAAELAEQRLTQRQKEEMYAKNFNAVKEEAVKVYGDKVDEAIGRIASENEMSFDEAVDMAQKRPSLFRKLFLQSNQKQPALPTISKEKPSFDNSSAPKRKSVMYGGTTRDMLNEMNRIREQVTQSNQ